MKKLLRKDISNRDLLLVHEIKRFILKNISKNDNISMILKWKSSLKTSQMHKRSSSTVFCNRCIFTGRRKRINKFFSFSRLMFLRFVRCGYLGGLKKSSW